MPVLKRMLAEPHRAVATAVSVAFIVALGVLQSGAFATPPQAAPGANDSAASQPADVTVETAVPADPTKVQVVFSTIPAVKAVVSWGRTRLGMISPRQPLVIIRPRDSGPLDVVVRARGFLPVQTRAQTFADTKLQVRLTPLDKKSTLLGYRAPLDAGLPLGSDGGVPETLQGMPPSLTSPSLAPPAGQTPAPVQPQPQQSQPQPQQSQPQPQQSQPQPQQSQPQPQQPQPTQPAPPPAAH